MEKVTSKKTKIVKPKTTVIYCTANTENILFEENIRKILQENCGDLPIISVSRLPILLGKNLVVGEKASISRSSLLRQLLKGLRAAKTPFCIIAKADTVYPPEYFSFIPPLKNQVYSYTNVWTLTQKYWQKEYSESAQICGTKFWIEMLTKALKGKCKWTPNEIPPVFKTTTKYSWTSENPVVTFRTPFSLGKFPHVLRNRYPKKSLPYWGSITELKQRTEE